MTLTYALVAEGGIILGADSERTHTQASVNDYFGEPYTAATYRSKKHKIQILSNGAAFSVPGNEGLVDMLLAEAAVKGIDDSKPYESVAADYADLFQDRYIAAYERDQGGRPHCTFHFCGYFGGKFPLIYKVCSTQNFTLRPQGGGFSFTGRENHGAALYLHHLLGLEELPLEKAKRLVYSVLAEVADYDNMVGHPIEMVVVTKSGVIQIDPAEFAPFEEARKRIGPTLRDAFFS